MMIVILVHRQAMLIVTVEVVVRRAVAMINTLYRVE